MVFTPQWPHLCEHSIHVCIRYSMVLFLELLQPLGQASQLHLGHEADVRLRY